MLARKPLFLIVFIATFGALILISRYGLQDPRIRKVADDSWEKIQKVTSGKGIGNGGARECSEDLSWLEEYKFTSALNYVSRDIITKPGASGRPLVTQIENPLFEAFATVDLSTSKSANIKKCLPPLELEVPHGQLQPVDASDMVFGLQTTIGRLQKSVKYLARWLPHTGARLYCIVKYNETMLADKDEMARLEKEFNEQGMNVKVINPVSPEDHFEQRYFSLVNVMYAARDEKTKWIVTVDDDTFFPSMHNLQTMLSEYDHTKEQYISALSEDWWAVNHYGLMGFGGASIILSVPLVKIMDEHMHECKDHPSTTSGDVTVMDCIYRFSTTKLTNIPELYQLDIHGDVSGFYESGRPTYSLHHWKEEPEKVEMEKAHLVADICDDCFLQRWQFPNDLVLSNGYSIQTYPQGHIRGKKGGLLGTGLAAGSGPVPENVEKIDLLSMEETWKDSINVKHSLEPKRPKLPEGAKIQYKMVDSTIVERGAGQKVVRQLYHKKGGEGERDTVMVLNWIAGDE